MVSCSLDWECIPIPKFQKKKTKIPTYINKCLIMSHEYGLISTIFLKIVVTPKYMYSKNGN